MPTTGPRRRRALLAGLWLGPPAVARARGAAGAGALAGWLVAAFA